MLVEQPSQNYQCENIKVISSQEEYQEILQSKTHNEKYKCFYTSVTGKFTNGMVFPNGVK